MKINNNNPNILSFLEGPKKSKYESKIEDKNSLIDMLRNQAKENETTNLRYKIEGIARRIARGDDITSEERALLEKNDPDLLRKADMAARRRKDVEARLKRAKTKSEARAIITEAKIEVQQVFDKDPKYAELLSAAYSDLKPNKDNGEEDKKELDIKI
ncbi:hypothetical protein [Tissierella sp.]|uniref:hypothetical protein n=1 Tax=Tissierella sp. TaxID=41274 RepID=UPI00285F3A14|nr:hypothetical protein [Tissierella sp.]MDR7855640.1 hypothetical protein [Tissierella sp.]